MMWRSMMGVFAAGALMVLGVPSVGLAAPPAPHWLVLSQPAPADFHPGDSEDFYEIIVFNDGAATSEGPATVTDTLPAGLTVNTASGCEQASNAGVVTVTCPLGSVALGSYASVNINVAVPAGASGSLVNRVAVSGGGAPDASATNSTPVTPASQPVPFGVSLVSDVTDSGGVDTQAGSHPFAFTTLVAFNVGSVNLTERCGALPGSPPCPNLNTQVKDVEVALPPGVVGNPTVVPYCKPAQFETSTRIGCPASTQVGRMVLYFYGDGTAVQVSPVYNVEPPPGQPGELGFSVSTLAHVPIFFHVRSDGDYGLSANLSDITQFDPPRLALLSIWGNSADPAHDALRESGITPSCTRGCPSGVLSPKPFLTTPTSCTDGLLPVGLAGDSWQEPVGLLPQPGSSIAGMTGCEKVPFFPSIAVEADKHQADASAGYAVHVDVPQGEELEGLASANLRDAEVSLPEGTVISPSAANGLVGCSDTAFGLKVRAPGGCPGASKIGTVKVTTPLLNDPLKGSVFIGEPGCSPCSPAQAGGGQMVRLFVEAEGSGVIVKLAAHTQIDQATGRLTTVFSEAPQLPFSDFELALEGGPNAPLVNPNTCGAAVTVAKLTPWSTLTATEAAAPGFTVSGCSPQGFSPSFRAGTVSGQAAAFSPFVLSFSRQDDEQQFSGLTDTLPPGLLAKLAGVPRCPDAQAAAGTCSTDSQIGTVTVAAGPGPNPVSTTGRIFLTGPYNGGAFGESVVLPATAGPFNLGTVVVRGSIRIDPHTTQATVVSDAFPSVLDGIPLRVKSVNVTLDRPGFTFNPTDCDPLTSTGTLTSTQGTTVGVSSHFQAVNCATLPFHPVFSVSTQAKASKKNGASLTVNGAFHAGDANIHSVAVVLPKQLPARLTTIQQACTAAVFNQNPAGCPAGSNIGTATAITPVLSTPVSGPVYLVSHGGAAFPDVVAVLQGEGVTVELTGSINIKHGITSSTFASVPDAPITSFTLTLPEGPHSGLAAVIPAKAKGNMCGQSLAMPFTITGQNGAVLKQNVKIKVTGCTKTKKKKPRHAKKRAKAGKK